MLEHLITRVKRSSQANGIILCTTELPQDTVLCEIASDQNIQFYRGPTEDKLARWMGAAKASNVKLFITADGDDIFCDPELIDLGFNQLEQTGADFIEAGDVPCGAFTYGIRVTALQKVCEIKNTQDTEMMWTYFKDTGLFKLATLTNVPAVLCRPEIRMTLDYREDFDFFKNILDNLGHNDNFSLRDIIAYLDMHPEVIALNKHLQEIFLQNQKAKTKLVLKNT